MRDRRLERAQRGTVLAMHVCCTRFPAAMTHRTVLILIALVVGVPALAGRVRQRLNYLETYTTDRCTTCHVAINDEEFSVEQLAQKLERALPAINEELQRKGLATVNIPTPPAAEDESTLPVGRVTEFWADLTKTQQDDYFGALLSEVNSYLALPRFRQGALIA